MARELAPAGARSGPALCLKRLGLLRSPAGASSLATVAASAFDSIQLIVRVICSAAQTPPPAQA
ncbi:hypothetical protein FJ692_07150 [Pseudomonas fluorescens]|uniref:Uncharacterized protein n=1 Tax=Pseudomonas fluorescens TaxID=294 RepID=A0A2T0ICA1_PSEFL|nr:hypothetical protein C1751_26245 [Pseudomonas fluorescens]PRW73792.1 hypothetical protein C7A12_21825 [Pseudomonas fluorescens]PRW75205.1 hypothetical protein C7A13_21435 [Pseudomonas fluorescens]PRW92936.1 hypothetical protein C7A10_10610 [Pseudomonas fluorescens]TPV59623.1 hypothetical protein FJ692_07150 [Pseudomonas fluorescens]